MKRRIFLLTIVEILILGLLLGCGLSKNQHVSSVIVYDSTLNEEDEAVEQDTDLENEVEEQPVSVEESLVEKMGRGINIGNSLDCFDEWNENAVVTETYWGNPEITEEYIKMLVDSGFKTIRIPVSWSPHVQNNKIDDDFMNRVKQVVDYAYNAGAYVIIDIHHDKKFAPSYGNYDFAKEYLEMVWSQVAETFKDYDERLIFEGINEPRFYGTSDEWTEGTAEGSDNVNKLMADFVNIVRSTGGNNETRLLLITCYCNRAGGHALDRLVIPDDDNLAVSVHSYDPYSFTSSNSNREFDDSLKQEFDYTFKTLSAFKNNNNIPVILTEWGAYESVGTSGRIEYINYVLKCLDMADIPCVWWDNGNAYGNGAYSIFDRWNLRPYDQDVFDAILKEN